MYVHIMKMMNGYVNWVSFGIDDMKVCLCIFVVSGYQNSLAQLFEWKEHNSDTCSRGNVLWFNTSSY